MHTESLHGSHMTFIYIYMKIESHALNVLSESFIGAFHIHCLSSSYQIASNFVIQKFMNLSKSVLK